MAPRHRVHPRRRDDEAPERTVARASPTTGLQARCPSSGCFQRRYAPAKMSSWMAVNGSRRAVLYSQRSAACAARAGRFPPAPRGRRGARPPEENTRKVSPGPEKALRYRGGRRRRRACLFACPHLFFAPRMPRGNASHFQDAPRGRDLISSESPSGEARSLTPVFCERIGPPQERTFGTASIRRRRCRPDDCLRFLAALCFPRRSPRESAARTGSLCHPLAWNAGAFALATALWRRKAARPKKKKRNEK